MRCISWGKTKTTCVRIWDSSAFSSASRLWLGSFETQRSAERWLDRTSAWTTRGDWLYLLRWVKFKQEKLSLCLVNRDTHAQQCILYMLLTGSKQEVVMLSPTGRTVQSSQFNFEFETFAHLYVRLHLEFLFWETQSHWVATLQSNVIFCRGEHLWILT